MHANKLTTQLIILLFVTFRQMLAFCMCVKVKIIFLSRRNYIYFLAFFLNFLFRRFKENIYEHGLHDNSPLVTTLY